MTSTYTASRRTAGARPAWPATTGSSARPSVSAAVEGDRRSAERRPGQREERDDEADHQGPAGGRAHDGAQDAGKAAHQPVRLEDLRRRGPRSRALDVGLQLRELGQRAAVQVEARLLLAGRRRRRCRC